MDNFVFLPEIADNSLSIEKVNLHWVTPDETIVNKGDVLMEVTTNLGDWKSRARLTPEGKATVTPENLLFLTPLKS